jgi:hypothetical protein
MSGKNVTWGKLLASRGLSPSQAKPSPPGRLGLGLEESEAKTRGFQAQAGASKPSQAVTSLPAVFNRNGSADYVSLKPPADRSFTQQISHSTTYFLTVAVSPEHV